MQQTVAEAEREKLIEIINNLESYQLRLLLSFINNLFNL